MHKVLHRLQGFPRMISVTRFPVFWSNQYDCSRKQAPRWSREKAITLSEGMLLDYIVSSFHLYLVLALMRLIEVQSIYVNMILLYITN